MGWLVGTLYRGIGLEPTPKTQVLIHVSLECILILNLSARRLQHRPRHGRRTSVWASGKAREPCFWWRDAKYTIFYLEAVLIRNPQSKCLTYRSAKASGIQHVCVCVCVYTINKWRQRKLMVAKWNITHSKTYEFRLRDFFSAIPACIKQQSYSGGSSRRQNTVETRQQ